jgi:hypothetical protein
MGDYDPVGHVCNAGLDGSTVAAICGGKRQAAIGDCALALARMARLEHETTAEQPSAPKRKHVRPIEAVSGASPKFTAAQSAARHIA